MNYKVFDTRLNAFVLEGSADAIAKFIGVSPVTIKDASSRTRLVKNYFKIHKVNPRQSYQGKEFIICDTTDNDLSVFVGSMDECLGFLKCQRTAFYSALKGMSKVASKYTIHQLEEDDEDVLV